MTATTQPMTKADALAGVVRSLHAALPDLRGVLISTMDGIPVAHDLGPDDAEQVASMAATALGVGSRIAGRNHLGDLMEIVVRGSQGHLIAYAVGSHAVLVLLGPLDPRLGEIRLEARGAAATIKELLARR